MNTKIGSRSLVIAGVLALLLSGCELFSPYAALYGTWNSVNNTASYSVSFTFNTDDTWNYTQSSTGSETTATYVLSGTYTATASTVTLTGEEATLNGDAYDGDTSFLDGTHTWEVDDQTLTLIVNGSAGILTKE